MHKLCYFFRRNPNAVILNRDFNKCILDAHCYSDTPSLIGHNAMKKGILYNRLNCEAGDQAIHRLLVQVFNNFQG